MIGLLAVLALSAVAIAVIRYRSRQDRINQARMSDNVAVAMRGLKAP